MKKFEKYTTILRMLLVGLRGVPGEKRATLLKKKNVLFSMGENCYWHPYKIPADPQFVSLGNNVVVCAGVEFITHDVAWRFLSNNPRYANENKCNRLHLQAIKVKDDVMIGAHAIILPGVTIGPNAIIGAGSVVTKDVAENMIVAGNPARVIGSVDAYADKKNRIFSASPNDGSVPVENLPEYYFHSC